MALMTILAAAQTGANQPWHHGGWWWFPFALIFWIGVALAIRFLVMRTLRRQPPSQPSGLGRARDILAERLARGEIDGNEYEERLSHLG